jgi:hypothetical protein
MGGAITTGAGGGGAGGVKIGAGATGGGSGVDVQPAISAAMPAARPSPNATDQVRRWGFVFTVWNP